MSAATSFEMLSAAPPPSRDENHTLLMILFVKRPGFWHKDAQ